MKKKSLVIIHSDGYISNFIDSFIKIGFDAVQSLEPSADVNIFSLFKKFNDKICFIGNLDIPFLIYGTTSQVKDYVMKLILKAKESNSHLVISPTQQINALVKPENIKTMIETTQEFKKIQ